jgi:hypothetical protein
LRHFGTTQQMQTISKELSAQFSGSRRLISFDYYDGTTSGIVHLESEQLDYKYDLVAWDDKQDDRVFCLTLLGAVLDGLVDALSVLGKPTWPCWYPVWQFPSEPIRIEIEKVIESITSKDTGYTIAILAKDPCTSTAQAVRLTGDSAAMAEQFRQTHALQDFGNWLRIFQ